jgi:hypothetical protein
VPCLHLVEAFADGQKLLEAVELHGLEGVVSKRRSAPYRSGRVPRLGKGEDHGLAQGQSRAVANEAK